MRVLAWLFYLMTTLSTWLGGFSDRWSMHEAQTEIALWLEYQSRHEKEVKFQKSPHSP